MDREVSPRRLFLVWDIQLMSYCSVLEAMIIVVNLVATIVVTIVTLGTIAPAMTVTAMTATAGMTVATAGNAPGRLLAAPKPMIVAPPGLHLPGGIMMIEGLQGTMTGEVAMMTEEALILTMTAAGTTTDAGMIAVGTRGTIATMTGPRGTPTGKADGPAEIGLWFSGFHPFVVVAREMVSRMASWTCPSRFASNRFCCMEKESCISSSKDIPRSCNPPFHGVWPPSRSSASFRPGACGLAQVSAAGYSYGCKTFHWPTLKGRCVLAGRTVLIHGIGAQKTSPVGVVEGAFGLGRPTPIENSDVGLCGRMWAF